MPPFIQCRQPPDDTWVTFDLGAGPQTIQVRQPPDFAWVPYTLGGATGGSVLTFPDVPTMAASAVGTVTDGTLAFCIAERLWFRIATAAETVIRNVNVTSTGAGRQWLQDTTEEIWFGPPRLAAADMGTDLSALVVWNAVRKPIRFLPSATAYTFVTPGLLSDNLRLDLNGQHITGALPNPVGIQDSIFIWDCWSTSYLNPTTRLTLDAPPGSLAVTVASVVGITVGATIRVQEDPTIARDGRNGNYFECAQYLIRGIAGNVLTLDRPTLRHFVVGDTVNLFSRTANNIQLECHGALVDGVAYRGIEAISAMHTRIRGPLYIDTSQMVATAISLDTGSYDAEASDVHVLDTRTPRTLPIALYCEENEQSRYLRCTMNGVQSGIVFACCYQCGAEGCEAENVDVGTLFTTENNATGCWDCWSNELHGNGCGQTVLDGGHRTTVRNTVSTKSTIGAICANSAIDLRVEGLKSNLDNTGFFPQGTINHVVLSDVEILDSTIYGIGNNGVALLEINQPNLRSDTVGAVNGLLFTTGTGRVVVNGGRLYQKVANGASNPVNRTGTGSLEMHKTEVTTAAPFAYVGVLSGVGIAGDVILDDCVIAVPGAIAVLGYACAFWLRGRNRLSGATRLQLMGTATRNQGALVLTGAVAAVYPFAGVSATSSVRWCVKTLGGVPAAGIAFTLVAGTGVSFTATAGDLSTLDVEVVS